ncbi:CDP-diacylglycerol--glycerol-3-phosphate 3-phosphatidyltransferase [Bacillus mexicanus]|uniref:CDP-diacylglycerol--glycerol-3-phosphate 3-phosphatidyltransferase n=1 Tax=Bacillus mexicanus TaxID=2834415 RepID=UPI003D1EF96E
MNLPNKISIARICVIPVFIAAMLIPYDMGQIMNMNTGMFIALIVFIFASLTDWVDGYLARKLNQVTNFGKFLDPLADKLLMTAGFIVFVQVGLAPAWIVILILAREFAVTGLRVIAASDGVVIAAAQSGKVKTTIQILTIIVLFLNIDSLLNNVMLYASSFITIYSGLEYFIKNKKVLKTKN